MSSAITIPTLDPRRHAFRPDRADVALRDRVHAARYVTGELRQVRGATAPVRRRPSDEAPLDTEALTGECVRVFAVERGWAWGQLQRDGYVGYLPVTALSRDVTATTHRVAALATPVFPRPDIKAPPWFLADLGAEVAVAGLEDRFVRLATGGFAVASHLSPLDRCEADFVTVAERFLGTPYLWGGRTRSGLDCSGLVQIALAAAGISAPRDSDMQQAALGEPSTLAADDLGAEGAGRDLARGDLVFWRGHVGIASDPNTLVHANAHHMAVVAEPLAPGVERIAAAGTPVLEVRRLPALGAGVSRVSGPP